MEGLRTKKNLLDRLQSSISISERLDPLNYQKAASSSDPPQSPPTATNYIQSSGSPIELDENVDSEIQMSHPEATSNSVPVDDSDLQKRLYAQLENAKRNYWFSGLSPDENPWSYPLEGTPCPNVNSVLRLKCPNPGLYPCSGCRLVSYCSKVGI